MNRLREFLHQHVVYPRQFSRNLDLVLSLILLILIFILPLLSANSSFGYEKIKVVFFLLLTTIAGLVFFWGMVKRPEHFKIKFSKIHHACVIFLALLIITSLFGVNINSSILGNSPYYQGVILYAYLYLFYLIASNIPIHTKVWSYVFMASSFVVSVWAFRDFVLLEVFKVSIPTFSGRVVSSFGQPNLYSGFILLSLPFTLHLISKVSKKFKLMLILVLFTQLGAIFISQSRAALLLVMPLLLFWFLKRFSKKIAIILISIFLIFSLVALGASLYFSSGIIYNEVISPQNLSLMGANSPEKRYYIWYVILQSIQKRPLLGYGLDNLIWEYGKEYDPKYAQPAFYHSVKDLVVDRSHNYLLDLLVFSGLAGLCSWLYLIYQLFKKDKSRLLKIWLLIYLAWIMLQIHGIVHLMMFWLVVALIDRGEKEGL